MIVDINKATMRNKTIKYFDSINWSISLSGTCMQLTNKQLVNPLYP